MRRPLVQRFAERWRTAEGNVVQLSLQDAPDVSQEADFLPRRIAVVHKAAPVHAGTVVYGQDVAYLLVDQVVLGSLVRFRAYLISDHLPWLSKSTTTDLVTLMPTNGTPILKSPKLPLVIEPLRLIDEKGFERPKYRVFTGADVQLGDLLGSFEVHTKVRTLGVHQLEVY